ncbi:MAG: NAD-dependent deacetylase [Gammaproteobacteria bacterium]|jgi:NAD-dependent deacetylase
MDQNIDSLRKLLRTSERVTIFTGAGISTESGIPDFRSPNGIWSKMKPIQYQDFISSEEIRKEAWRRKVIIDRDMACAEPNVGHRAVSALVKSGKCQTVITQNIDGLHQVSGVPAGQIVELHGNGTYAACLSCKAKYDLKPILDSFSQNEQLTVCSKCGGIIKTATISFGQSMPVEEMERAKRAALNCDLFLVLGSSLVVYPAAAFPGLAKDNGAALVIINREPTEQDPVADLVLHKEIGETLSSAVEIC